MSYRNEGEIPESNMSLIDANLQGIETKMLLTRGLTVLNTLALGRIDSVRSKQCLSFMN